MTDKLTLYNRALGHLQERRLASLSEAREPRRVLDDIWADETAYCLERHLWQDFASRVVQADASVTTVPTFGFNQAFVVPPDWVRTRKLSSVATFEPPLLQVTMEAGFWYTNITPIFVDYISNDPLYGMNIGGWPPSFANFVALRLARVAAGRIANKAELLQGPDGLLKQEDKARKVAMGICAMNEAVAFPPQSSWVRSRRGFTSQMPAPGGDNPTGGSLIP
jgi:hypothetical protein